MKRKPRARTPKETNELVQIILSHLPAVIKAVAFLILAVLGATQWKPVLERTVPAMQALRFIGK